MLANDIRNYQISDHIAHYGILGQKWGIRRFQDKNGRLTTEGKKKQSEKERWDRFNRWVEKEKELYNTNAEYKKSEDRIKDLRKQLDTIELEIVSTDVTKERREALEKKAEPLVNEVKELEAKSQEIRQKEMPEFYHSDLACEVYSAISDDDYLAHHGILGMRWGIRRFQNPDGTRTAAGKARYNEGDGKSSKPGQKASKVVSNTKLNKQRKEALEKARQAKAAKAEYEAEKKKALESGDYKQIQKYANDSTTKELQDALMRADTIDRINKSVEAHTPKQKDVWDTIDDVAKKVGTTTNAFNKGKDAWNSFANAWNTFADNDSMLPELGTNFAEQKEKKRKEAAEASRKAQVEELTKTVDPAKIMKNQSLFTDAELKSAKERIGNYEALKLQNQLRTDGAEKAIKEAEARAKEQLEKNRKDKIASLTKKGDISEILKNKDLFTNDELESASARYESLKAIERKIDDVSPKDLDTLYKYLDDWND